MLPGIALTATAPLNYPLKTVITNLGLLANAKLILDAGDAASYASGQSWNDTSGNNYHFILGATNSAEASDPTFNGNAGRLSANEFWNFDGADYFTLGQANPTWVNNLHKDGAQFAMCAWLQFASLNDSNLIFGTLGNSGANVGIRFRGNVSGKLNMVPGSSQTQFNSTLSYSIGIWQFVALSINENGGASAGIWRCNGTSETFNPNYSGPSASNANSTAQIGAQGAATTPFPNGTKLGMLAAFEGAVISDASLAAIYAATRRRYGV
ncbi:hypothetical protein AB6802_09625 [Mesorhizobium sp. RCC_202]|uniref:hypothetical protein n=1 Tax=Mesorhizobium sp. RCC_202 TaxID=3239222 RepID=UPI003526278D